MRSDVVFENVNVDRIGSDLYLHTLPQARSDFKHIQFGENVRILEFRNTTSIYFLPHFVRPKIDDFFSAVFNKILRSCRNVCYCK